MKIRFKNVGESAKILHLDREYSCVLQIHLHICQILGCTDLESSGLYEWHFQKNGRISLNNGSIPNGNHCLKANEELYNSYKSGGAHFTSCALIGMNMILGI